MAQISLYNHGLVPGVQQQARTLLGDFTPMPTQAIGDALSGVSSKLIRMSEMQAQANDTRQALEADKAVQKAQMEFEKWKQENGDEEKWMPEWQKRRDALEASIGQQRMTDNGRAELQRSLQRNFSHQEIQLQGAVLKRTAERTLLAGQSALEECLSTGNKQGYDAVLDRLVQGNVMFKEQAEAMRKTSAPVFAQKQMQDQLSSANAAAERGDFDAAKAGIQNSNLPELDKLKHLRRLENESVFTQVMHLANEDPLEATQQAKQQEHQQKLTSYQRVQVEEHAQKRMLELRSAQLLNLQQDIRSVINNKDELQDTIAKAAWLTPQDRTLLSDFAEFGTVDNPLLSSSMVRDAANFSGPANSPQVSVIKATAAMLPEKDRQRVETSLQRVLDTKDPGITQALGTIYTKADEHLKMEVFGQLTSKLGDMRTTFTPKVRREIDEIKATLNPDWEKLNPTFAEKTARNIWWQRQPAETRGDSYEDYDVTDMDKAKNASLKQQQVMDTLHRKLQAGEIKDTQALQKLYYDLTQQDAVTHAADISLRKNGF